jgi:CubicO group peptidase (beta-lactamase class C family)
MSSRTHPVALALLIAAVTTAPLPASAQRWTLPAETQQKVDAVFDFIDRGAPGCALGVVKDGALAYGRGYGLANLDWGIPLTTSTVFDIGSVSKQFTATALALLDLDGVLSLDDEVPTWIPELPDYGSRITIRHLLNHTSGIRDYLTLQSLAGFEFANVMDEHDGVELIVRQRALNFEPGSEYLYSNSGYLLLANVVRRATGQSLREFLEERVFDPLGMAHTSIWDDNTEIVAERATGYSPGDGWEIDHAWNFQLGGDGQVITSIDDLVKWDANFYDPVVGGTGLLDRLHTQGILNDGDTIEYALGLRVGEYRGLRRVAHGGAWAGFRAHLARFPDQRTSIIVECNRGDANTSAYVNAVSDAVLEDAFTEETTTDRAEADEEESTEPVELDAAQFARWVGVYRTADRPNYWRFEVRDGALHIVAPDEAIPLVARTETSFVMDPYGVPVRFQPQTDEWPEGVRVGSTVFLRQDAAILSGEEQRALVGSYWSPELAVRFDVTRSDGSLWVHRPGRDPERMQPGMEGEFEVGGVAILVRRDESGTITGLEIHAGRVTGLVLEREGT